jgi:predicted ABC-class ATPase
VGLPAKGRRILGKEAINIFFRIIPKVVNSLFFNVQDKNQIFKHVECSEDAAYIRSQLNDLELVAFVADGAILPRKSGISQQPLNNAIRLKSPDSLSVIIKTPNNGDIRGLGIPLGVTLVVGGGYHGKSTLLNAVELGVYNHIPGDGREMVITNDSAVKIRAEDGRSIEKTDISSFIHDPPLSLNTLQFSTENASGSTSQAANIVEAVEAGSKLLLFDEDTCATNFMIRDHRMQKLVDKDKEPITPFIDRVQELYNMLGISTILVMGGSGDYFDVADSVIMMDHYQPNDVTKEALKVARNVPTQRKIESNGKFNFHNRCPLANSINPFRGRRIKLESRGRDTILLGQDSIDLSQVEQLVNSSQTRALSYALNFSQNFMNGERSIIEILSRVKREMDFGGLDILAPSSRSKPHNLSYFRIYELAAALNRLRTLKIR